MNQLPINHESGLVNCVVHSLSGAQVLFYLFHIWEVENRDSAIIWCGTGETYAKVNAIRVALSKERAARKLPRTFELRFSESWPHTHMNIKGEAIKVERLLGSQLTQLRAAMVRLTAQGKL